MSRWKTGLEPIGNKNALKVAQHFRCNVHWLQTLDGDKQIGDHDEPFIQEMRATVEYLTEKDKEELLVLARMKAGH